MKNGRLYNGDTLDELSPVKKAPSLEMNKPKPEGVRGSNNKRQDWLKRNGAHPGHFYLYTSLPWSPQTKSV